MDEDRQKLILDAIFAGIFDPVAIYKVVGGGGNVDLVYLRVNDAYCLLNNKRREDLIGSRYTESFRDELYEGWQNLMLKVAATDNSGYNEQTHSYVNSGYFEGLTSCTGRPGGSWFEMFAFSPIPGHVVSIIRDKTEWYQASKDLRKKEKQLLSSQEHLRRLAASLTLAEEKTRRAIATTLHDALGYSLVSLLHRMKALQAPELPQAAKEQQFAEMIDSTEKLIDDARAFTFSISPPLLYELGLDAALASRCEHMERANGVKCVFSSNGQEKKLAEDTKILLYQIAHELLVNVAKHASAGNVAVRTRWGAKRVQLYVEDDGVGFLPDARKANPATSGMGLFSIRERLEIAGGKLDIVSTPGHGTIVSVILPISKKSADGNE